MRLSCKPLKKKLRLKNARSNYMLKLESKIAFKMDLDPKKRRPLSKIAFKMDLDQKERGPFNGSTFTMDSDRM